MDSASFPGERERKRERDSWDQELDKGKVFNPPREWWLSHFLSLPGEEGQEQERD